MPSIFPLCVLLICAGDITGVKNFSKIKNAKAEVNNTNTIVLERLIKSLGLTREPL